jgi:hypothetical protein
MIMRKIFVVLFIISTRLCLAQQNLPFTTLNPVLSKKADSSKVDGLKADSLRSAPVYHFSFYGIGNLSNETLQKINGGGKLALSFNTNGATNRFFPSTYYLSFNKNASNSDSVLVSTLVFPETGNHTFLASAFWTLCDAEKNNLRTNAQFFFEFATKKIGVKDTAKFGQEEKAFQTLHYTAGLRYTYGITKRRDEKDYNAALGFSLFASNTNIPDEDNPALESIINGKAEKNSFWSAGIKIGIEINGFQIFADLRHVFGDEQKLPIKDLKGFNSNIGVAFNTEIFRL